jgi:hypothetical protein
MKSGNGTSAAQTIYLLVNFPYVNRIKVGITGNLSARTKNITETTKGMAITVLALKMFWAWQIEKSIHNCLRKFGFHSPMESGSGKTEWHKLSAFPFAFFAIIGYFFLTCAIVLSGGLLFMLLAFWFANGCPNEPVQALARLIN